MVQVCSDTAPYADCRYSSFRALLEGEGVSACLPNVKSVDDAVAIYKAIPGYAEKEAKFGVLALRLSF